MADLDFGGILKSLLPSDLNFCTFGGIYAQQDQSNITDNPTLPPALFNDVLDCDFGISTTKNEMFDLFSPSMSNTDQFLDNLISEMDKVEQDNQHLPINFEQSFSPPALQQTYFFNAAPSQAPEVAPQFEHVAGASSSNVANQWQHDHQSQSAFSNFDLKPCVDYQPNLLPSNFVGSAPDFFLEQSLPQPAETVEVEYAYGDEHSYASCDEKHSHNRGSSHSPFSSSSSIRSGTSTSSDHNNKNPPSYAWQFPKNEHSPDSGMISTNFEEDDFDLATFRPGSSKYSQLNSFLKRGCRRRARPNFMSNISSRDFGCDDKVEKSFPMLMLSEEEKLVAEKEGIRLPTKFPFTKQEERDLRRIRRKIRNKHSAQESRRKKHEYISSLEERVKACDKDNAALRRHVETLSKNNKSLAEQLRRLQNTMGNANNSSHVKPTVQAGTCLAVLLLSFALLVAPNYNLFGKRGKLNKINSSSYNSGRVDNAALQQSANNDNVKSFGGSLSRVIHSGSSKSLLQLPDDFEIGDNTEQPFMVTAEDDFLNASRGLAASGAKAFKADGGLKRGHSDPWLGDSGGLGQTPPSNDDDQWWTSDLDVLLDGQRDMKRMKLESANESWHRPTSVVLRQRGVKIEEF